jgi:hypothetical protein
MVGDLHGMIIPFVDLASTYNYNEAVKNNQPIVAQAYADALSYVCVQYLPVEISVNLVMSPRL